jgi:hypothetical protein
VFPIRICLSLALLMAFAKSLQGASPPLIEVEVGKEKFQGRVAAQADKFFWLLGQDGRLRSVKTAQVQKFRQVTAQFSGWSASVLRDQLRREFGKPFDVVGTRHYTVCAVGDRKARAYAETLEELYRSFHAYFSVRGFKLSEPEFPLVAVVFSDYATFARYAQADEVPASKTLKGYYLSTSNRIALYEDPASAGLQNASLDFPGGLLERGAEGVDPFPFPSPFADGPVHAAGAVEASLKDTMIHEATHQVAFNMGLHSRIGESPKWVVEGLATVFEAPGIRNSSASAGVKTRINRQRFICFGNYSEFRRKPKSLESFVAGDDLFKSDVLDAYSQAWAFSFFLVETRPRAYAEYLRTIAARDPLAVYPAADRIADFKRTVSKELPLLEAEFLRFMGQIK